MFNVIFENFLLKWKNWKLFLKRQQKNSVIAYGKQKKARAENSARVVKAIKSEITSEGDYYCREKSHHLRGWLR